MLESSRFVALGWSPDADESQFVVSPTQFCRVHKFSPCQAGVISCLSRYQFEKNIWLLKQSILLLELMIKFGDCCLPWHMRMRKYIGLPVYLAPKARNDTYEVVGISTYCVLNGIATRLLVPLNLICDSPTRSGLSKARDMLKDML